MGQDVQYYFVFFEIFHIELRLVEWTIAFSATVHRIYAPEAESVLLCAKQHRGSELI